MFKQRVTDSSIVTLKAEGKVKKKCQELSRSARYCVWDCQKKLRCALLELDIAVER
jgi:hypothetical protein